MIGSVQNLAVLLGYGHRMGRKQHHKSSMVKTKQSLPKPETAGREAGLEVYFFDKPSFGTHSQMGCVWFKKYKN